MRFIVYGSGAIGGTIGARLYQAGFDVVLIARGAHLQEIQKSGLTFSDPSETVTLPIPAVAHPSEVDFEGNEVVLLTMKTQDTERALESLRASVRDHDIAIACVQNGVENERLAARRFRNVYGTVVILPATHLRPGAVESRSRSSGVLDTGRYPAGVDATAIAIATAFTAAGFSARPDPFVMRLKYTKLLQSIVYTVQAAIGAADEAEDIASAARSEAVACLRAAGIEFASDAEFSARREAIGRGQGGTRTRHVGGSSWQSLARGTGTIEADYLNGEISLLGAQHGVDTPVNRALQRIAVDLAASKSPAGSMTASQLRRRVMG